MDIETYQQKVAQLFQSGAATEEQWKEMANAVLQASENNSDNTIAIDRIVDPESVEIDWYESTPHESGALRLKGDIDYCLSRRIKVVNAFWFDAALRCQKCLNTYYHLGCPSCGDTIVAREELRQTA